MEFHPTSAAYDIREKTIHKFSDIIDKLIVKLGSLATSMGNVSHHELEKD
jgi:hypothetical protein